MTQQVLTPAQIIREERTALVQTLRQAQPTDPTLCEGWQCRHLLAHLVLRETEFLTAAGIVVPFLSERTTKVTNYRADSLIEREAYDRALDRFENLDGYLKMRKLAAKVDRKLNLIEYFVHIEDVRRARPEWKARVLSHETQQAIWEDMRSRAKMMAAKNFPHGLIVEAPGFVDGYFTVIEPKENIPATILTGEPGELALYLFGREDHAKVELS